MADYSQTCAISGSPQCKSAGTYCESPTHCKISDGTCAVSCPDPLPNSHYVSDTCQSVNNRCFCNIFWNQCTGTGTCGSSGACYYDCNEGYEWDGSDCVLSKKGLHFGDGLVMIQT